MKLNGAEILIRELSLNGVTELFGYPGASVLPVYDALYDCKDIKHILAVSESGAVFMADGYARASGRVGVCLATSGPGATNLVTGIAGAFMDSIPLVVITGNVPIDVLGHDAFQEVDTSGITMPITKYNFIVKDVSDLATTIARAFELAESGRKGPVVVDIPTNVFTETEEFVPISAKTAKSFPIDEAELLAAATLINNAKRPVVYAGGGVISSGATDALKTFVEKLSAPVAVSMMGLGAIDCNSKYYFGVGTSKNRLAKKVLSNCDLFICLGARLSNKALEQNFTSKKTKLLHIDIDRAEIGKNISEDCRIVGDLSEVLLRLIKSVNKKNDEWLNTVISIKVV
jgi:Thiamine pyrophosphate-requiring enzymes [acetolactate synthase, pyruvate dehydrogenase (cytochrome), glyoxylate carboligase, phosphonopyruvate decarboxylase]